MKQIFIRDPKKELIKFLRGDNDYFFGATNKFEWGSDPRPDLIVWDYSRQTNLALYWMNNIPDRKQVKGIIRDCNKEGLVLKDGDSIYPCGLHPAIIIPHYFLAENMDKIKDDILKTEFSHLYNQMIVYFWGDGELTELDENINEMRGFYEFNY